ncbi:YoqO family protein [Bacillus mobilis]|uniref:YoqO-like protein n=2 Tax=Bacillus cereus group TaxID=86661 RepID=A0A1C4EGA9_BACCE|nr:MULTISPECIES: YoqO family protein [Bacillus cereus group]MCC2458817.1 YoqO family protein [Bacillus mobilis]MCU5432512.1 YoqO family protein [Bacillus mobilis]MCU5592803.1 YoqO family protein [Bacillus mobilis]MCU5734561.1 YoqO family protein [Bacillus mobilis]MCU9558925.1 YoqO family protein [Bacillus mobilis]
MREKIGYYGALVCLLLSVVSGQFLKSEWVPVILCMGVLIFAPMYRWKEWKAYSRKKKIVFSIEFVIVISAIPFLLLKGNEIIDGIVMFQGWLFIAKLIYLICILTLVAVVAKKVNEKLFANE